MALSFKYRREIFKNKEIYYPKIPVILYNGTSSIQTPALLDSGATNIFIPKGIAEALGLSLDKEDIAYSWNGEFKVLESEVGIILGRGNQTFRKTLPCFVSDQKYDNGEEKNEEVVLGRVFFKFFTITFDESRKMTKLKKI